MTFKSEAEQAIDDVEAAIDALRERIKVFVVVAFSIGVLLGFIAGMIHAGMIQ